MDIFEINKPKKLDTPYQATHKFVGGPKDGDTHDGLVHYELDGVIMCINGANYKYIGDDTFEFAGMTSTGVFKKETLKQKIMKWLLS